mmetsp:Transcript_32799/g.81242  ORF Transcript_32799/g.81242 Transcript_32799/m.81242 type:complete len:232 (-) Transcript_32799:263-958(-)
MDQEVRQGRCGGGAGGVRGQRLLLAHRRGADAAAVQWRRAQTDPQGGGQHLRRLEPQRFLEGVRVDVSWGVWQEGSVLRVVRGHQGGLSEAAGRRVVVHEHRCHRGGAECLHGHQPLLHGRHQMPAGRFKGSRHHHCGSGSVGGDDMSGAEHLVHRGSSWVLQGQLGLLLWHRRGARLLAHIRVLQEETTQCGESVAGVSGRGAPQGALKGRDIVCIGVFQGGCHPGDLSP